MVQVPNRVAERLSAGIKRFQPIIASAKTRDINEADTVTIVKDILSEVFGYDKYSEITSETAIRSTWCDLAIKMDSSIVALIEVKAIGIDLKEAHTKQAVDYSANQGTDWVILTNGEIWRVYKVIFAQPISSELILEFNFSQLNSKKASDIELIYHLTREGRIKSALGEYHSQRQALSRFFLGALILSPPILDSIRRELRKLSPNVKIDNDQIRIALMQEVLKREVIEGDKYYEARKKISRIMSKQPIKTRPTRDVQPARESFGITEGSLTETEEEAQEQESLEGEGSN